MTVYKTGYISTSQLAKFLGISTVAVFKRIKKGQIKAAKIGRSYAIPESTIQEQFPAFPVIQKDTKEYVSVIEASNLLGVSRGTILNRIKSGSLEATRVGRHYVIEKSHITETGEVSCEFFLEKDHVSVPELAEILGISRIAVFKKIKKGQIKARKVGRHYVIAKEEVLKGREEKAAISSKEYMSVMDVAQLLSISRIVVFQRIRDGKIKAIKIGRSYAIRRHEIRPFFIDRQKGNT